jgi:hypothetical protein
MVSQKASKYYIYNLSDQREHLPTYRLCKRQSVTNYLLSMAVFLWELFFIKLSINKEE